MLITLFQVVEILFDTWSETLQNSREMFVLLLSSLVIVKEKIKLVLSYKHVCAVAIVLAELQRLRAWKSYQNLLFIKLMNISCRKGCMAE